MIWAFGGFLIFLVLIVCAGLRNCSRVPVEFSDLARDLGITLVRSWESPETGGAGSPIRYGPCYAAIYRELAITVATVVDHQGGVLGTGLSFRFMRPLSFPFFCALNVDPFAATMIRDEYRDIYQKRIETGIDTLKAWAGEKDKATLFLQSGDVRTRLERLAGLVLRSSGMENHAGLPGLPRAGFMINERGISLLVKEPVMLNHELVEAAFGLCRTFSGSGFTLPGRSVVTRGRGLKVWAIMLLLLFMGFIVGVMIMGILKIKIFPLLSVWGLN